MRHWLEADEQPRCQHCPSLADERSFMCEGCASQADEEVQTLRDRNEALMGQSDLPPSPLEQLTLAGLVALGALDAFARVAWPLALPAALLWLLRRLARSDVLHAADGGRP